MRTFSPTRISVSRRRRPSTRRRSAFSQTLPNAIGDALACVLLAAVVACLEPARLVAFAAAVTLVAAAALLVSRRAVGRAVERAWKVQERVYEAFGDALEGRLEIVAAGRRGAFMADLRDRTLAWSAAGVRVAGATVLSGRLALAAVAGLVSAALFADGQLRGSLTVSLTDVALFASVTPAFAGVAQGVHGLVRDERWVRLLARVIGGGSCRVPRRAVAPALAGAGRLRARVVPVRRRGASEAGAHRARSRLERA